MESNEIKDVAVASAPLMKTPLAPLVLIGGVGILAVLGIKKLIKKDKHKNEPLQTVNSTVANSWNLFDDTAEETVQPTVQTVKPTVQETVSEQLNEPSETVQKIPMYTYTEDSTVENEGFEEEIETSEPQPTEEEIKKELLRQAMSELGKRSGEARRRKKLE